MLFSRGLRCSTLLILCLSSILLSSQTTSAPEQPSTQSGAQTTPASEVDQYTFLSYENLFRYMCFEDQLIQNHTTENGLPLTRIDYSSAIGIRENDEQVMLNIILAGCDKQLEESNDPGSIYEKLAQTRFDILKQTWAQLQQSLTLPEFESLDAYIKKDFALPRYPDQRDSRRKSIALEFEVFIEEVNDDDIENRRLIASGQEPQQFDYSRAANFPEEKEQAVLAILLHGGQQLSENARKIEEAVDAACGHKPPVNVECLTPPERPALDAERVSIAMETVSRLKLELGEESFDNFDKWISQGMFSGR